MVQKRDIALPHPFAVAARLTMAALSCCALLVCTLALAGCSTGTSEKPSGSSSSSSESTTSTVLTCTYDESALLGTTDAGIDVSHATQGYIAAVGKSNKRLKLLVTMSGGSYNYDMNTDGTPVFAPLNMGDGSYKIQVMENTTSNRYVQLYGATVDVTLDDEFQPFLHPSQFCNFTTDSACVAKAQELCANASSDDEKLSAIYDYVEHTITYDQDKAAKWSKATGYVPDPDQTLEDGSGICFDYASLSAAMLRSQGIPTKIITGTVSPDNVYHAWNMVYLDNEWRSVEITVKANEWVRIDLTMAAGGDTDAAETKTYTDRFVY